MEKQVDQFLGRTYLGPLCRRGHDNGKGLSIRYTNSHNCIACMQANNNKYRQRIKPPDLKRTEYLQEIAFNRRMALEKGYPTYFGGVCKRGHDHGNGFSRRYTADRDCTICRRNGKRSAGTRDDVPAPSDRKTDSKPKKKKKKKKNSFLPVVPIHVAPTSNLETIDKNYKKALEDRRKVDAQMRRENIW